MSLSHIKLWDILKNDLECFADYGIFSTFNMFRNIYHFQ